MTNPNLGRQFRRTGDVFTRVAGPLHPFAASPDHTNDGGEQDIPVRRLIATQKRLNPETVKQYLENPSSEPITVVRGSLGGNFIYDGHHRAAAAKARGEKTVRAKVREF